MKIKVLINVVLLMALAICTVEAQEKVVLFDMSHGQQDTLGMNLIETYRGFVEKTPGAILKVNKVEITSAVLKNADVLIVLTPIFPTAKLSLP